MARRSARAGRSARRFRRDVRRRRGADPRRGNEAVLLAPHALDLREAGRGRAGRARRGDRRRRDPHAARLRVRGPSPLEDRGGRAGGAARAQPAPRAAPAPSPSALGRRARRDGGALARRHLRARAGPSRAGALRAGRRGALVAREPLPLLRPLHGRADRPRAPPARPRIEHVRAPLARIAARLEQIATLLAGRRADASRTDDVDALLGELEDELDAAVGAEDEAARLAA